MKTTALLLLLTATGLAVAADKPAKRQAPSAAKPPAETPAPTPAQPPSEAPAKPETPAKGASPSDPKFIDGMSILGNQEAPKALVIVPWKSSELGGALGIAPLLDDSRQPVDRDVFLRALSYYTIRSERKP